MSIKKAQQEVDNWINNHGVRYFNELTNMAQLTEEVGEVARIIARRYGEQSEKESDKKKRDSVDARNQADSLVFSTEKSLKEHGDKVSTEEKKAIESAIADLKKSLEGTDVEDIKKKTQSLIQVSMKLGEAVYKSQQKPNDDDKNAGGPSQGPKDAKPGEKDNVVDADFEDIKEDKEKSA